MSERTGVVLIAEDDENDVYFLQRAFEKRSAEENFRCVSTGEQALDYLEGNPPYRDRLNFPFPVLLIVDLKLPGLDGFDLISTVHQCPKFQQLPIIVLSGSDVAEDKERAIRFGALEYHVKSNDLRDTQAFVARICSKFLGQQPCAQ